MLEALAVFAFAARGASTAQNGDRSFLQATASARLLLPATAAAAARCTMTRRVVRADAVARRAEIWTHTRTFIGLSLAAAGESHQGGGVKKGRSVLPRACYRTRRKANFF
eukprot:3270064-Prymnesium_polylepis.1